MSRRLPTLLVIALAACQVQRAPLPSDAGPADLPSLRRASVALQDRIRLERSHVDEFSRQLRELGLEESQLYGRMLESESSVQQLQDDLDGVLNDLDAAEAEYDEVVAERAAREADLERVRGELVVNEQESVALRAASERLAGELEAQRRLVAQLQAERDGLAALTRAALLPNWTAGVGLARATSLPGHWSLCALTWTRVLQQADVAARRSHADLLRDD